MNEYINTSERLKTLITAFVLRYNFWGYLFSRVRRKEDNTMPAIMGVGPEHDGTISLYYNSTFMKGTDDATLLKVIEHEGLHLLNKHIPRLIKIIVNEADPFNKKIKCDVWNIAADCSVNQQCNMPEFLIINKEKYPLQHPSLYNLPKDKISEWYFLELLKNHKILKVKGAGNDGECYDNKKCVGYHGKWKENLKGVVDLESFVRKINQHVNGLVRESIKSFNKDRGTLPNYISELIPGILDPPKVPYYQIIRKLIKATRFTKFQRSPTRINRKRTYTFHLSGDKKLPKISPFPGKQRDFTFYIVVMIDTSGSMSPDDIREGLSGIKNIIENDKYCSTTVLEVDAGVEKEYDCKKIRDIQFNVKGRGGTTLTPGLIRAKELGCDVCLSFTDGYTEDINSINRKILPKKIIWVITKGGQSNQVNKTGYVVHI